MIIASCKDEEETCCDHPLEGQCQIKTMTEGGQTSTFHYIDYRLDMIVSAFDDTTQMIYGSDGKLKEVREEQRTGFFNYKGDKLDRIWVYDYGLFSGFYQFGYDGENINLVENYLQQDTTKAQQVLTFDYQGGEYPSYMVLEVYQQGDYLKIIEANGIETDSLHNPYSQHLSLIYLNIDNPFAFGSSNVTSAALTVLGQPTSMSTLYVYNGKDYPTEIDIDIPDFSKHTRFNYDCY